MPGQSRVLESSCVARGTAAFSVRLDIRSGHPAENSTELRINGDSTPHGQNWLRRKTSLSRLGISRNGDATAKTPPALRQKVLQRQQGRTGHRCWFRWIYKARFPGLGAVRRSARRWGWGVTVHPQRFSLCRFGTCIRCRGATSARHQTRTASLMHMRHPTDLTTRDGLWSWSRTASRRLPPSMPTGSVP